jgi:hypothetical protein
MKRLLVFKHSCIEFMNFSFRIEQIEPLMDHFPEFFWNGHSAPHDQESLDTRHPVWFVLLWSVIFFFLTLFWFCCLGCFITSIIAVLTSKTMLICFATGISRWCTGATFSKSYDAQALRSPKAWNVWTLHLLSNLKKWFHQIQVISIAVIVYHGFPETKIS